MKVVRRYGVTPSPNSPVTLQQTFGEVLVARIGARGKGDDAAPLAISGTGWTRSLKTAPGGNRLALTITRGPYAESEFDARGTLALSRIIDLPSGTTANAAVLLSHVGAVLRMNGRAVQSTPVEQGTRATVVFNHAGHYTFSA